MSTPTKYIMSVIRLLHFMKRDVCVNIFENFQTISAYDLFYKILNYILRIRRRQLIIIFKNIYLYDRNYLVIFIHGHFLFDIFFKE